MTVAEGARTSHWDPFLPYLLNPIKVAIIEALDWVGEPMAAKQFQTVLEDERWALNLISHHLRAMAKCGLLEVTSERKVRGATQTFFFFPE